MVVYGKTEIDHIRHLKAVLKQIEEFGLGINTKKSKRAKGNVTLLEYKVGDSKMKPLPEKMLIIKNRTAPTSKRKLKQFMGRAAFYRHFIKNFKEITAPLYKLLGDEKFIWTKEAQEIYDQSK